MSGPKEIQLPLIHKSQKNHSREEPCVTSTKRDKRLGVPLGVFIAKTLTTSRSSATSSLTQLTGERSLSKSAYVLIAPNLITERLNASAEECVRIVRGTITLPFLIEKLLRRLWNCCETSPFRCSKGRDDVRHSQVYWIKTKSVRSDLMMEADVTKVDKPQLMTVENLQYKRLLEKYLTLNRSHYG